MVMDSAHVFSDGYSTVWTVDQGRDSADLFLANHIRSGDLLVTQDYALAALALGKGASALSPNGMAYTGDNIDRLLFERHIGQKQRRAGKRSGTVKKRTHQEDEAFRQAMCRMLEEEPPKSAFGRAERETGVFRERHKKPKPEKKSGFGFQTIHLSR